MSARFRSSGAWHSASANFPYNKGMVFGIDVREAAGQPAGKGRYAFEMMTRLPELAESDETFRMFARAMPDRTPPPHTAWSPVSAVGPLWHLKAARQIDRECDLYFSPTSYLTPQFVKIPTVITVHDLVAFSPIAKPQFKAKSIERLTLRRAAERAAAVITVSQSTADDLAKRIPAAAKKIRVIHLAADDRFRPLPPRELTTVRDRYNLPKEYILFTGTLEPRKNVERLIRAYKFLPDKLRNRYPLVLAGKKGWGYEPVFKAIRELGLGAHVRHLGYVGDQDLAKVYAGATLFCYPSLYEGFGLPILEAMRSGVPVITSNVSALPEVGGKAVRYVDPAKATDLSKTMTELLEQPERRRKLAVAGLKRAGEFSWDKTARQTADLLRQAADRDSSRVS